MVRTLILLVAMGTAHAQQPADGGPWAPVVVDPATATVAPAVIAPGQPVSVALTVRPEHRDRIRAFALRLDPNVWDGQAETAYDPAEGVIRATIPAGAIKLEHVYEVRLDLDFEWTDRKVYHRSPQLGSLTVRRHHTTAPDPAAVAAARADLAAAATRLRQQGHTRLADALVDTAALVPADGDGPAQAAATAQLSALARVADAPYGTLATRLLTRAWLADHKVQAPPLTLMVGGSALPEEVLAMAKAAGFNAFVVQDAGQATALREAGFTPSTSRAPARFSDSYVKEHPEHRQERYLLSQPATAESGTLAIDLMAPYRKHGFELDQHHEPRRYWRVYDRTTGGTLTDADWLVEQGQVHLKSVAGHIYQVAFLVYMGGQAFFDTLADPIHDGAREVMQTGAKRQLARLGEGGVYRPTALYYPFPKLDADGPMGQWNWWGYQWGAGPAAQELFEQETGIKFDPRWMTDEGRYGHINYPPAPEYLAWMRWQQQRVNAWTKDIADFAHSQGVKVRVFWGDHWIGAEPYGDFFEASGADGMVKACASAVVSRSVTDFPNGAEGVIRFSPWLSWGELFRHDHPAGRMMTVWADIRQAALFDVPDGLSWGGETIATLQDPVLGDAMRAITDDYRFLHAQLHGHTAYRHPLTVYVANSWGRLRSWAGWGQLNPSTDVFDALAWLPVNVKFISLREIADSGVPADANVVLNAGEPGSAWSGGRDWRDPRVAAAIARFVEAGGGLLGIDAPSHTDDDAGPAFRLAPQLGVDFGGYTSDSAALGVYTFNDRRRLQQPEADWHGDAVRKSAHWLAEGLPETMSGLQASVYGKPVAGDVQVVYGLAGGDAPMVTARQAGGGRAVWIGGFTKSVEYAALVRRAIFWAARQEPRLAMLDASPASVRTYLYPSERLLIAFQYIDQDVTATVRCDPALLDARPAARYRLVDVLRGETVAEVGAEVLRRGVEVVLGGRTARILRVEAE